MHALGAVALEKLWERVKTAIPTKVSAFTNDSGYLTESAVQTMIAQSIAELNGLPSGYTKLNYIQSTGLEYINTGYIPNNNTRILLDFEILNTALTAVLGGRRDTTTDTFALWVGTTQLWPQYGDNAHSTKPIETTVIGRHTIDFNKNVVTIDGTTVTFTVEEFDAGYSLLLFGVRTADKFDARRAVAKAYSMQIFDNTTLVRDYIPCMDANLRVGLFDRVNKVFYPNSGEGSFIAG